MGFYTVKEMSMRYSAFSESALRNLIANKDYEQFQKCVLRPGGRRKVVIDESAFLVWLKNQYHDQVSSRTWRTITWSVYFQNETLKIQGLKTIILNPDGSTFFHCYTHINLLLNKRNQCTIRFNSCKKSLFFILKFSNQTLAQGVHWGINSLFILLWPVSRSQPCLCKQKNLTSPSLN